MFNGIKKYIVPLLMAFGSLLCLTPTQFRDVKDPQIYPNNLRRHFEAAWTYLGDVVDNDNGKSKK